MVVACSHLLYLIHIVDVDWHWLRRECDCLTSDWVLVTLQELHAFVHRCVNLLLLHARYAFVESSTRRNSLRMFQISAGHAQLTVLIRAKGKQLRLASQKNCMVFTKSQLGHSVRQVENAGHTILSVVLVFLLLAEVFAKAVYFAVWPPHDRHAAICSNVGGVRVQHRHHDGRRLVVEDSRIRAPLLHQVHLKVFSARTLHRKLVLPLLEKSLEDQQIVVVFGLLLR